MRVVHTIGDSREALAPVRRRGGTIGFVPTMGYLHEGHLSLIDLCRQRTEHVVVSIYVNPLQFGPDEDYERYPRDLSSDIEKAEEQGVDLIFAPDDGELYPSTPAVVVVPKRLGDRLCGRGRPGHFEGVLTVVTKLFGIIRPDVAVFGQKDFQQSVLIRRLVMDLNLPIRIEVGPTVREPDGLAMSSRNEYLSAEERERALTLSRGLAAAVAAYRSGETDPGALASVVIEVLERGGGVRREYVECVSPRDLEPVSKAGDRTVIAVAAHIGDTRLIDNVALGHPDPGLEEILHLSGAER